MDSQKKRKDRFLFRDINANYFLKKSKPVEIYEPIETEESKALKKELDQIHKNDQKAWLRVKDIVFK
ncbi:MAG: hypothetical protein K6B70_08315 [Clostridia bacterium]|nr:hypothetical protein [Clostridia bacterium]